MFNQVSVIWKSLEEKSINYSKFRKLKVGFLVFYTHNSRWISSHGYIRGYILQDHTVRCDFRVVSNLDVPTDYRLGSDHNIVSDLWMSVTLTSAPEIDVMKNTAVVSNHGSLPNDDPLSVIEHDALTDFGTGVYTTSQELRGLGMNGQS